MNDLTVTSKCAIIEVKKMPSRQEKLNFIIAELQEFDLYSSENNNVEAEKAVIEFFEKFMQIEPDENLHLGARKNYFSYMIQMLCLKKALEHKNYQAFCHELLTIHHYEQILQKRIYYNLIYLYNAYLR